MHSVERRILFLLASSRPQGCNAVHEGRCDLKRSLKEQYLVVRLVAISNYAPSWLEASN